MKSETVTDLERIYSSYDGTKAETKIAVPDVDEIEENDDNNTADQIIKIADNEHHDDDTLNVDADDFDHYHGSRPTEDLGGENKKRRYDIKSKTSNDNHNNDEIVLKESHGQLNPKSESVDKDVVGVDALQNYDDDNDLTRNLNDRVDAVSRKKPPSSGEK